MSSKQEQRALVPTLKAGGKAIGIIPETFDDCFRLAQCASMSGTIPNGHDQTPEAITMVILFGLELGIPPIQSMQNITKINGKFCIYGDLVPALLWSHNFDIEQSIDGEADQMTATCTITRPNGKKITRTFSVADAKVAGLWGKSGPWKNFPKRMLGWRALGFAKSDGAADIMRGLAIVEVERDIPAAETTKLAVLPVPTDIADGTEVVTPPSEAEASQAKPEAEEPSAILMAYEAALKDCETEKAVKAVDKAHKSELDKLDADLAKAAEDMRAKAIARIKGEGSAQGALV